MKRLEFLGAIGLLLAPTLSKDNKSKVISEKARITSNGKFMLESSGNLGIGTINPSYKFNVTHYEDFTS